MDGNPLLHAITLKCDAPGCGHEEAVPTISADLVGKPCPSCGASLLTEEDFEASKVTRACFDVLAILCPELVPTEKTEPSKRMLVGVNAHAGEVKISLRTPEA